MGLPKEQLPTGAVPALPAAVATFLDYADGQDEKLRELAAIVESDGQLVTDVLRYVQTTSFGGRSPVTTVEQAFRLLGSPACMWVVLAYGAVRAWQSVRSPLINSHAFAAVNLERALFAREIARQNRQSGELAFAASWIQDLLMPELMSRFHQTYSRFLSERSGRQQEPLHSWEQRAFGWDHAQTAGKVLARWNFPDEFICAVMLHHSGWQTIRDPNLGRTAAAAVAAAAWIPDELNQAGDSLPHLAKLHEVWPEFDLLQAAAHVDEVVKRTFRLGGVRVPLLVRVEKYLMVTASQPVVSNRAGA